MEISYINHIKEILKDKSKKIVLISHVNPDGDAVGSSLGMYHFLKKDKIRNVSVILPGTFPSFLSWMPGSEKIIIATNEPDRAVSIIEDADMIFCLDFNDPERTAALANTIKNAKGIKILIDHHPDPKEYFDFMFSVTQASSTAELIFEFISKLNKEDLIDKDIASCLYAGIVTDTGSFSYACNYPRTYHIIAHFMTLGIDGENIHRQIYDTYSEDRMRLLGHCLSKNLKVLKEQKTAYIFLSSIDLKEFNYQEGDSEGVVNYALSIKDIQLGAIFIERKDEIKISFRSEGSLNVNLLARKYFNGGGHRNASGGSYKDTIEKTIAYFEKILLDISRDDFSQLKDIQDNP